MRAGAQISIAPNGALYPFVQSVGDGTDSTYRVGRVSIGVGEQARAWLYAANAEETSTAPSVIAATTNAAASTSGRPAA